MEILRTIIGLNQTYWNHQNANNEELKPIYYSNVDFPLCIYFMDVMKIYRLKRRLKVSTKEEYLFEIEYEV